MRFETKKRIVFAVVCAAAVWPALHHVAVQRYDVNPWMFFGLSMYTRPRPIVTVVDVRLGTGRRPLRTVGPQMLGREPAKTAERIERLTGEIALARIAYGSFARPQGSLRELFDLFPKMNRLLVRMRITEMDDGARMASRLVDYRCTRGADGSVACELPAR